MSIDCRDIPNKANAYIDREATTVDFVMVTLHLAACRNCRTYVKSLRITRRLAASSLRADVPPALKARLRIGDAPTLPRDEDSQR